MRQLKFPKFLFRKFIAFFVLLSFTSLNLFINPLNTYAEPPLGSASPRYGTRAVDPMALIGSLTLPEELGSIQEMFIPTDSMGYRPQSTQKTVDHGPWTDGLVIYLQSAHTNFDSETNTRKLIEFFQKEYGLPLVLLEGGEGRLDSLFFKSFPDERAKEKILNDYVNKGELSGAEIASILNEAYDTEYYGIETQALYNQNKDAFLKALQKGPEIGRVLDEMEMKLEGEIQTLLSSSSQTFHEQNKLFRREEIDLLEYLKLLRELYLKSGAGESAFETQYPELAKIIDLEEGEKRFKGEDYDTALTLLIRAFQKKVLARLPREEQMELNQMIQLERLGHLAQGMLVKRMKEVAREVNFSMEVPEVLKPSTTYAKTLSSIKGTRLFDQLEALEGELRQILPKTQEEREFLKDLHTLQMLRNLKELELVHGEWQQLQEWVNGRIGESENIRPYADTSFRRFAHLKSLFIDHFRFYELATQRDQTLFENLLRTLHEKKAKISVVVTGGFHSEGITQK
ncbi:MAG: hypothetical protein HY584_01390, partial [Candidatus Omnitrophica bacterium]|nr:hypothetical protein [Candidatus Omnitrophota bacterium]